MGRLIITSIAVFILNIPFGYWRAHVRRFSAQWFLAIHIPVPFIITMRILGHIGFAWYTYLFLVAAFFLGQQCGALLIKWTRNHCTHMSSCLVMDLLRCART